ncbi:MAG: GTP cyclohydrolase I FolE [Bifidobacteriaceae bacterium]|nr:GTP cyclohydrolase I FolE [Aeriscardovia sp.]MEE1324230.1 GTP cyclohydrolase I FolE [Bifidobacteriaceae bacterium]
MPEPAKQDGAVQTPARHTINQDGVRAAIRLFLESIGEDPNRPGLQETPDRVARACEEIFGGLSKEPQEVFDKHFDVDTDDMILVRDIHFYSICEHHLLPFFGMAHIGYIPQKGKVVGLSKIARLVEVYARRPQVQEQLTEQIADALVKYAGARGVIIVLEAQHMCMTMRGVQKTEAKTVTSAIRGMMRNPGTRSEAMRLILDSKV